MSPTDVVWVSVRSRPGVVVYHEREECYARQGNAHRIPTTRAMAERAGLEPCRFEHAS